MMFRITFTTVAIMLLYALPGFLMVRTKLIKQESISAFASMLMYVCTPALTFYSLNKIEYSAEIMGKLGLFFVIAFFIMLVFATLAFLVFRKKYEERQYRIYTIASFLGNCTFMGVPLLEALFPEAPIAVAYSIAFFLAMNIICWTFGSYVITQDRKYISLKKVFINPAVLSVIVAVPLWMLGFPLPGMLMDSIWQNDHTSLHDGAWNATCDADLQDCFWQSHAVCGSGNKAAGTASGCISCSFAYSGGPHT
ncbi:MAG: AEC family transporter [Lachnospiraceae bacterium]|nr:AEC family transporter [Lachnospiraceae bacterium]